jgi:hypothetical protein
MKEKLAALAELGFTEAGSWVLRDGQPRAVIARDPTASDLLYAFTSRDEVLYIGKSTTGFSARMAGYEEPGPTQATNIRVRKGIAQLLAARREVRILVFVAPSPQSFRGYRVSLAAGLEDELIRVFQPRWNRQGKRRVAAVERSAGQSSMATAPQGLAADPGIWERIRQSLLPGSEVGAWSVRNGDLGWSFTVVRLMGASITVKSPGAASLQVVPKHEIEEVFDAWMQYTSGIVRRDEMRRLSRHTSYIISMIHHVVD